MTHLNQPVISSRRDHLIAVFCLLVIGLIYFAPLLSQFQNAIPGRTELTDVTEYVWSVGWVQYALDHGLSLFETDLLFAPFTADLHLNTQQLLQSLAAYPFINSLGVIGAFNLVLIASFILNGILAYGFVYSMIRHAPAAFLSAVCLMLSCALVWHFGVGRSALPALWIVISNLWCFKDLLEKPHWLKGAGLGLLLLTASFTDLHILLFSILWLVLFLVNYVFTKSPFGAGGVLSLLIAFLVWGVPFSLYYLPSLTSAAESGYAVPRLEDMAFYSFQLKDFANPGAIPFIYGYDFLLAVVGALVVFRWKGEYRFWLLASMFILSLTLGPYLKPHEDIPLPYSAISLWTPAMQFRVPFRFVMPALIGWSVTMGFLLLRLLAYVRNWHSWLIVILFACMRLVYTAYLVPLETQIYPEYRFYDSMRAEAGDFTLLEVPFGIRSGLDSIGNGGERFQYYQHIHNKRLVNGSVSRLPVSVFEFYRSHPVLLFLAGESVPEQGILQRDFADILKSSKIKYVVVHRSYLTEVQAKQIETFLETQPQLDLFATEGDLVVYQVQP